MKYIKFNETGTKATEAPARIKKTTGWIFGYNSPKNEKMLLEDGYIKYDGNLPISCLTYKDGKIIENMPEIVQPDKTYTKLQIRRAMRKMQIEDMLDYIISPTSGMLSDFGKDWNDAQEICLSDPAFIEALQKFEINEEIVNQIIENIQE